MNKDKYVFSQIMPHFPRCVFEDSVKKYKGDFHAKNLNSYSHCLHLIFGQLAGCKSLKDITLVLWSINKAAYHLGISIVVDSSSLFKANESRDYRIFDELGMWLIRKVRPMYAKENVPDAYLPGWEIFSIDSTTIPCSVKLAEWDLGKYSKGGVKMHMVLDLRGSIPEVSISRTADGTIVTSLMYMSPIDGLSIRWIRPTCVPFPVSYTVLCDAENDIESFRRGLPFAEYLDVDAVHEYDWIVTVQAALQP